MKNTLFFIIKVAISLGLILWAFSHINLNNVKTFYFTLEIEKIILILVLSLINLALQYFRYSVILDQSINHYTKKQALISFLAGFALRLTIPGGHGEIGKLLLIPGKTKNRLTVYGVEKFTSFMVIIFLFGFATLKIFPRKLYLFSFSLIPILIILLYSKYKNSKAAKLLFVDDIFYSRLIAEVGLITVAVYIIFILQYWTILSSYGIRFLNMASISIVILASTTIPISISGIGVRENVCVALLQPFGVPGEVGLGVPLLVFFFNVLVPASVGAILLAFNSNTFKGRVKSIRQ